MKKEEKLAKDILYFIGGPENVHSFTNCMTRLRVQVKNDTTVDMPGLKKIDGVMGVVEDETIQVVVGPGMAAAAAEEFGKLTNAERKGEIDEHNQFDGLAERKQSEIKKKNQTPFKQLLRKIGSIFIPLIPGLIASGVVLGLTSTLQNMDVNPELTIMQILALIGNGLFAYLAIFVGINTAREFGGTPVLGGIAGILIISPDLAGITLFGQELVPGQGGLIAAILGAWLLTFIEKKVRRFVPMSLDIIVTPLITLLVGAFAIIILVQPIGGFIASGITTGLLAVLDTGGAAAGAILAGTFLPLVMVGMHHGLTPVHLELINSIGSTPLLPVLAMAGAGQVGASLAIFSKTKNDNLKKTLKGALPVGFLGVGEPLIYGVTLPLGRPFLTACLGGAVGGAFQAVAGTAATAVGISGLPLTFIVLPNVIIFYLLGLVTAYAAGFLFTYFWGFNDSMVKHM